MVATHVPTKPKELVLKKMKREVRRQQYMVQTRWLASDGHVVILDKWVSLLRVIPMTLG